MEPLIAVISGLLMLVPVFNVLFGAMVWGWSGFIWGIIFTLMAAAD